MNSALCNFLVDYVVKSFVMSILGMSAPNLPQGRGDRSFRYETVLALLLLVFMQLAAWCCLHPHAVRLFPWLWCG